ncbi:MAG: hypothetical protein JSV09_06305 [Thermoplasmata archaeon]|nr:MAG: hypothetical protein JSV09_06305 [Thermoplasmata archaeon]
MGLVMLLTIILLVVGFFTIYSGKVEYGPAHFQKVSLALIFFILFIAISVGQVFFSISVPFWGGFGPGYNDIYYYNTSYVIMYIIFSFFSTLFLSLGLVYLIIELASREIKNLLWITFGLNLIISTVSSVLSLGLGMLGVLSGGLGIIVLLLVMFCYWKTYIRIREREIMPIPPPFMPPPFIPPGYPIQNPPIYSHGPPSKSPK